MARRRSSFVISEFAPTGAIPVTESTSNLIPSPVASTKASRKRWILATIVLLGEVAMANVESQFTFIGFNQKLENTSNTAPTAGSPSPTGTSSTVVQNTFKAPFFYGLLRFFTRSLTYLFLLAYVAIKARATNDGKFHTREFIKKCSRLAPGREFTFRNFVKYYTLPILTVTCTGILYILALDYIPPSVTSASFCAMVALSYILNLLFLKGRHAILKSVFVIISFAGVAMIGYETSARPTDEPQSDQPYIGVICVVISTCSLSLHQIFFSKSFPNADSNQVAFIVSIMFGAAFLLYWPVPLAMRSTNKEIWYWSQIPWGYVIGGLASTLGFAFLYSYGLALSNPFFMSLGELLSLAISGLIDYLNGVQIGPLQIAGSAIIGLAFVVLLIPEEHLSIEVRRRLPKSLAGAGFNLSRDNSTKSGFPATSKSMVHSVSTTTIVD